MLKTGINHHLCSELHLAVAIAMVCLYRRQHRRSEETILKYDK